MNRPTFTDYVSEYESEGIGELLYSLIVGVIARTVRRYSPIYSPNGIWDDDAIIGLCHDFTIEKLLKAKWLDHYLLTLETSEQLRRVLDRDFRHFLINKRQRNEYLNIVKRAYQILRKNPVFKQYSSNSPRGLWGLSSWEAKSQLQNLEQVVNAMYKIALPPLVKKYHVDARKLPHLIHNDDLFRLLERTFSELDAYVSFDLLVEALRYRLNLYDVELLSFDEPIGEPNDDTFTQGDTLALSTQDLDFDLTGMAEEIFVRLSDRQKNILLSYQMIEKPTLEQIGDYLSVSKSTIGNELKQIQLYIASLELTDTEAEIILAQLFELCDKQQEEI